VSTVDYVTGCQAYGLLGGGKQYKGTDVSGVPTFRGYRRFGGTYCLRPQSAKIAIKLRQWADPNRPYSSAAINGTTFQKKIFFFGTKLPEMTF